MDPIIEMPPVQGNVYFISDCHFGLPDWRASMERESRLVAFLDSIAEEVTHLFLLGDVFDFWFEYKDVVPKHCLRFLGRLAQLVDRGVKVYYILGNHDMWSFSYIREEIGLEQIKGIVDVEINGKRVRMGHGDALDPKDKGYLLIKWIYAQPFNQRLFAMLHPRQSFALARFVSRSSRRAHEEADKVFRGEDEPIIQYCRRVMQERHFDFFLFGHRHLPCDYPLSENCRYLNTGDWLYHDSYVVMKEGEVLLGTSKNSENSYCSK
ncbi:MAG: UDP-2,3-diacylglucosamine diphosphatase [Bacteroidales bacterium]|nr:UDP-2,3-diacylglucosamine diphosphatase [Bacteroidales bacterium]